YLRTAVTLDGCSGEDLRPVSLLRLRAATPQECEAALVFSAGADQVVRHVLVQDSRLEGPCKALVRVGAAVSRVTFQGTRFSRAEAGVVFRKSDRPGPVRVALVGNPFCERPRGRRWERVPAAEEPHQVVVRNNLFARTRRLCQMDPLPLKVKSPAQWVWS